MHQKRGPQGFTRCCCILPRAAIGTAFGTISTMNFGDVRWARPADMVIREVLLEGRRLHCIYCTDLKRPIGPHGWYSATTDPAALVRLGWGPDVRVGTVRINTTSTTAPDLRNGTIRTFAAELAWLPP